MRGYEPLVSDTLPKMPYIRGVVPSDAEPVVPVGTNPVELTLAPGNQENLKGFEGTGRGENRSKPADFGASRPAPQRFFRKQGA